MVEPIVRMMMGAYTGGRHEEFNRLANKVNAYDPARKNDWTELRIKLMFKTDSIEAFRQASKAKEIIFHKEGWLGPVNVIKAASDPIYYPALPDDMESFELSFEVDHPLNWAKHKLVGVFLRIYDHETLPDNPRLSEIRYRLSRGFRAKINEPDDTNPSRPLSRKRLCRFIDLTNLPQKAALPDKSNQHRLLFQK
jgi:hypothetical protein